MPFHRAKKVFKEEESYYDIYTGNDPGSHRDLSDCHDPDRSAVQQPRIRQQLERVLHRRKKARTARHGDECGSFGYEQLSAHGSSGTGLLRRYRRYSDKIGAFTIPDFFSRRYGDKRHTLACIAALVIIIFFVPYTASGFKAVGTLFNSLFGFDYHTAMIVGAVVIIGYTTLGGFLAVSTTDLIQSIFMTIALVVVVFFGISQAGGFDAVMKNANSLPGYFDLFGGYDMATNTGSHYGFLAIVSTMAWGLGYFGMPHILLRFMAIRNEKELVTSRRIASVWVFLSMGIAVFIGIIGNALSSQGIIQQLTTGSDAETIIIKMADLMGTHGFFMILMAGIIMAGILAATMSTADSQLLAAASSVSQDLLQDFFGIKLSRKASMRAARLTVIGIAVLAVFLAWNPNSSVFRVISFAWAGFGATFGPTMLIALFWRRSNKQGALAGMIVGAVMVFRRSLRPLMR